MGRSDIEESRYYSGLWYYGIRIFPPEIIAEDYGPLAAELLRRFELFTRMRWKNPDSMLWNTDDFRMQIMARGLEKIVRVYRGAYGMPVLIPILSFFYRALAAYPNLNTVYGERGSGKTIFAWVTAYLTFKMNKEKYDDFQIYVYGDVDGLTHEVMRRVPDTKFRKALIYMDDYEAPEPEEHVGKFILYNELDETLMSGNTLQKEQQEVSKMLFRSRHYMYWMFYNVIRYKSIMKTVRITSSFQSYKPLSMKLMEEVVEEAFPRPYKLVVLQALGDLEFTQALTSIPMYRADMMGMKRTFGSKHMVTITPIFAPKWLLDAAKHAKKNYEVGSDMAKKKEQKMVEIAVKMFIDEGKTLNKVVEIMEVKYKFKRGYTWWRNRIRAYLVEQGYEFENLREVQEHVRLDRISKEIIG